MVCIKFKPCKWIACRNFQVNSLQCRGVLSAAVCWCLYADEREIRGSKTDLANERN
jgi:hypothetical protein